MSVMKNSQYCYVHNPAISEKEKAENRRNGGKRKMKLIPFKFESDIIELSSSGDVKIFLSNLANSVLKNEINVKVANSLGYICSIILRNIETNELEKRIETLEKNNSVNNKENFLTNCNFKNA